jgi:hypothetical protein
MCPERGTTLESVVIANTSMQWWALTIIIGGIKRY